MRSRIPFRVQLFATLVVIAASPAAMNAFGQNPVSPASPDQIENSEPTEGAAQVEIPEAETLPPPVLEPIAIDSEDASTEQPLGYEPLIRGPVHEAFAAPADPDTAASDQPIVKPPPPRVDEQPPELQDDEQGMEWISGYWAWDDETEEYVWVSGMWRRVPPGRSWVEGSWSQTPDGYRWTRGYWSDESVSAAAADYLPEPPASIDNGPGVPPPNDDYFWVPGHWEYAGTDYRWRSGFWSHQPNNWVWHPSCYVNTPNGYLWVDGYWDYLPPVRGQLYAPVRFYEPLYLRNHYVYRPRYPLANAAVLLLQLFARPGYPHYYYGNHYGGFYLGLGYRPWYDFGFGRPYAAPWFSYYDWKYRRSGIHFARSLGRHGQRVAVNAGRSRQPSGYPTRGAVVRDAGFASRGKGADGKGPRVEFAKSNNPRALDAAIRSNAVRVNPRFQESSAAVRGGRGRDAGSQVSAFGGSTPGRGLGKGATMGNGAAARIGDSPGRSSFANPNVGLSATGRDRQVSRSAAARRSGPPGQSIGPNQSFAPSRSFGPSQSIGQGRSVTPGRSPYTGRSMNTGQSMSPGRSAGQGRSFSPGLGRNGPAGKPSVGLPARSISPGRSSRSNPSSFSAPARTGGGSLSRGNSKGLSGGFSRGGGRSPGGGGGGFSRGAGKSLGGGGGSKGRGRGKK